MAFWLFILLHTLLWTLGPWLTRSSLPHDTLESITWGMQWQWGYNKHPFLAAWLSAGIRDVLHATEWPVYLLAQLAVSITFIATWRLARKLLLPMHAVIATMALDGVLYYNINSFNITPDSLQSPLWALLALFFYQATKTQLIRYWLATGMMIALCIVTKYQVAILLVPMILFCLTNKQARLSFFHPGLYIAMGSIFLLISPHLLWLWQHDFLTIRYALGAPYDHSKNNSHILCVLLYIIDCMAYTAGAFLVLWPFYRGRKQDVFLQTDKEWNKFDKTFLFFLGLGPCILTAVFCFIHGESIPSRWSTPYFFLTGIMMMSWLKPKISSLQLKQFAISILILSGLLWGARMSTIMLHSNAKSDAFLPNKMIATQLAELWRQHYSTPLHYVGGAHYLVGAITPYMTDNPMAYFSWDLKESPWISEQDLRKKGGIFVWDEGENYFWDAFSPKLDKLPEEIKQRFPDLLLLGTYTFYRTTPILKPVLIGVALLPPKTIN